MAINPPKKPTRRRPAVNQLKDQDANKRCPSSLAQTVLAVQQYWLNELNAEAEAPLTPEKFLEGSSFGSCFADTLKLYPGVSNPPRHTLNKALRDMAHGDTDMEFYKLRTLAKFIGLRPAGLVLLFSQLVGEERRAKHESRDPREACIQLLDGVLRVAMTAKTYVESKGATDDIFMRKYDHKPEGYLPDVAILKKWSDVFQDGPLPPDVYGEKLSSEQ